MSESNFIIPSPNPQEVSTFDFMGHAIRLTTNNRGNVLFVASDLCNALEVGNISQALSRLDDDEKDEIILNDVTGRRQSIAVLTESGMYSLVLSSRKPEAKSFKKWVTSEVLPSIRKTGSYSVENRELSPLDVLERHVAIMRTHERELAEHGDRLDRLESVVSTKGTDYMTIKAYCSYRKYKGLSKQTAITLGKQASTASRNNGYEIGKVPDETHGEVSSYHMDILAMVVDGYFTGRYD